MTDSWYYADQNGNVVGPLAPQELKDALANIPNAADVLVWRENFADWKKARDVPELRARTAQILPPPLPIEPAVYATNNHRKTHELQQSVRQLEPTWQRAIRVWWLIFWRGLIGSMIIGGVVGLIIDFIGRLAGVASEAVDFADAIVGTPLAFVWLIAVQQMALRKHYRDFRLALIPHIPHRYKAQELEPTWQRAIRVWWLIFWRWLVGYMVITVLVVCLLFFIDRFVGSPGTEAMPVAVRFILSFAITLCILIVWQIAVQQMALRKCYRDFRIAVVPFDRSDG